MLLVFQVDIFTKSLSCMTSCNNEDKIARQHVFYTSELYITERGLQNILKYIFHSISNFGNSLRTLQWRHNGRGGISNYQPHDSLLNRLFRRRSKKTPTLRVTGASVTGEFPAQRASNAKNVSIWWCYHDNHRYIVWYQPTELLTVKRSHSARMLLENCSHSEYITTACE